MKLSEEEKKAIEDIKKLKKGIEWLNLFLKTSGSNEVDEIDVKAIDTILNLIEKQQKEIEENQVLIDDIKEHRIVYIDTPEFEEKFISKDKIREKIEKLKEIADEDNLDVYTKIDILEELLEEE